MTSIPPNTLVFLLVEKGIAGTLLYILLGLAVICSLWRQREQHESRIIACTLLAFGVSDMSHSVWQGVPFLMFMVYLLLVYLQKEEKEKEEIQSVGGTSSYIITVMTGIAVLLWNIPKAVQATDQTGTYLKQKDYRSAWRKHPEDRQLYYLYASRTLVQENPAKADSILEELVVKYPRNSLFLRSYAGRCYENGQKKAAQDMMAKAICLTPRLLDDEWMMR